MTEPPPRRLACVVTLSWDGPGPAHARVLATAAAEGVLSAADWKPISVQPVVVATQLPPAFNLALGRIDGVEIIELPPGPLVERVGHAQVLVVGPIPAAHRQALATAPAGWPFGLEWVQLASSGVDSYPDWMLDGLRVTTAHGLSAVPVAEMALAAIFAAAKEFPQVWIDRPEHWRPVPWLSMVEGATLGIFGLGAIGRALAQRALGLGMDVVALRRGPQPLDLPGVRRADDLANLVGQSDHLVLAAPLTPSTRHTLNAETLAHAKPGLHIVNVARGEMIDDEALLAALDSGLVRRATLDVTAPEPLPAGHPYYSHPAVRLSPHAAMHTPGGAARFAHLFAANLERFRTGAPFETTLLSAGGASQ